ncbi:high-affinity iron transporter [Pedobacter sp. UYP30]|uniref:FTR1 family protein n=1 Tax=Pedobacter sp. UYP30 TaxID=1756400 RepID=UPI0033936090
MKMIISSPKHIFLYVFFTSIILSCFSYGQKGGQQKALPTQSRTIVNLLDYISQDYQKAVIDGKIINPSEYREMIDFTSQSIDLFDSVAVYTPKIDKRWFDHEFALLLKSVKEKNTSKIISSRSQSIKKQFLSLNLIEVIPEQSPDMKQGKVLFLENCKSCHGAEGKADGLLSDRFKPRPLDFQDTALVTQISPLQIFNTTKLGIKGTGMRSFGELSDKEVWDIAFYVKSLPFRNKSVPDSDSIEAVFESLPVRINLSDIARLSDNELKIKLKSGNQAYIEAIRLHQSVFNKDSTFIVALAHLKEIIPFYKSNNFSAAENKALYAYLDGIEPVEQQLAAIDAEIVPELERKMNAVRAAIKSKESPEILEDKITQATASIHRAMVLLGNQTYSFWFTFLVSYSILLREGIEAVLIIITIISLLKSLNAKQAVKWVHGGWLLAVGVGFSSWFFTGWLISFGAQNRELIEAFGALLAVTILLYVAFWLHSKTEAQKWKEFIEIRIRKMLDQQKLFGLAFISFIVVFREAFESVIFLSSLQFQVDNTSRPGIWMGALTSIIIIFILSNLILRFSIRIPVKKLFQYSAVIIMIFIVVLAGQGIHAFQESGWVSVNSVRLNFHSSSLGIYPTIETYAAQTVALTTIGMIWYYQKSHVIKAHFMPKK